MWEPIRTLRSGVITLRLDDIDPERDCQGSPADRLSPEEIERWRTSFDVAWQLILEDYSAYAPGLAAGLSTITPLRPAASGRRDQRDGPSGARRRRRCPPGCPGSAGLVAAARVPAHARSGAILDAYDLYDESDHRRFYAPWREDPRPFEGLLQGTYAHIAVADFWRTRRLRLTGPQAEAAEAHFARWRLHTAEAIEVLAESGSLTPLGDRFVEGMRATVTPWLSEQVSDDAAEAARRSSEQHLAAYRRRVDRETDI